MKLHTIYRIYCTVSKKCYVGVTCNRAARKSDHFSKLRKNKHRNTYLQNAYNKYGRKAFKWQIIETNLSKEDAYEREIAWIDFYDSFHNGYNASEGGEGGTRTPCEWNGVKYLSISEAATANNVTLAAMQSRIAKGYTCDNDMAYYQPVTWNGMVYQTFEEAAKACGISKVAMYERIKAGYTCDDDMVGIGMDKAIAITWNGVEYDSINQAAAAIGVTPPTMWYRYHKGYTCDDDMTGYNIRHNSKKVVWNDVEYPSIRAAAKAIGVSNSAMSLRIKKGYTCDDDVLSYYEYPASERKKENNEEKTQGGRKPLNLLKIMGYE